MKVLTIGSDTKLFEDNSPVLLRQMEYAKKMEELHIIVFTLKKAHHQFKKINNLFLYPTNSATEWLYVRDGYTLGKKILKNGTFSAVSTQDPFQTGFVGVRLSQKWSIPLQVQIHTDFLSAHFTGFFNQIRRIIALYVIPHAKGIRVVSEVIRDSLQLKYPNLKNQINVLPAFVDVERLSQSIPAKNLRTEFPQFNFIIFMASRLTKEKRIDIALGAMKKVLSRFPQAGLVIAGSGPERSFLQDWTKQFGISKNVAFLGWQEDLLSYYKTADMFLLTSEYEGYGMTLIEAGASGCPIVTTKVGVAKTDLFKDGENCFVCPVGDVNCLAQSIIKLVSDTTTRQLFAKRMQDSIRSTSISKEVYVEKYVDLLKALL